MIYYDYFTEEYVAETEVNAPPERYLAYMKGGEGIYTERYSVYVNGDNSFRLDFSYTEFERNNYPKQVVAKRQSHFEIHNINPKRATLIAYIVPPSDYKKIIEEWNLKEKGGEG